MPVEEEAFAINTENDQNMETQSETSSGSHENDDSNTVPFYKLFTFSDKWDKLLMVVGTISSIGNELNPPLVAFLFGRMTDAFGRNQTDRVLPLVSEENMESKVGRFRRYSKEGKNCAPKRGDLENIKRRKLDFAGI